MRVQHAARVPHGQRKLAHRQLVGVHDVERLLGRQLFDQRVHLLFGIARHQQRRPVAQRAQVGERIRRARAAQRHPVQRCAERAQRIQVRSFVNAHERDQRHAMAGCRQVAQHMIGLDLGARVRGIRHDLGEQQDVQLSPRNPARRCASTGLRPEK